MKPTLQELIREQRLPYRKRGHDSIGIEARFAQKYVVEANGCWRWLGTRGGNKKMYGTLAISHRMFYAHIVSYFLFRGDVPSGLEVCHDCDNPICVNPSHLFLGTHRDNMFDMIEKGRNAVGEKAGRAVLTEKQAMEIKNAPRGMAEALSRKFGISKGTVYDIKSQRSWAHL